jgi:catechol 2,3-dioxygenase-like lactoylglutathione lyase family enzyme
MNIKELNHVAIRVADMEKSVHFYTDILNGTIIRDACPDGKNRVVYVQIVNGVIEFIQGKAGVDDLGLQHIAFLLKEDTNLDSFAEELRLAGYKITVEPRATFIGNGRLCFFEDGSGVALELIQRNEKIRIPNLTNPNILDFDHISINLHDGNFKKCADFYLNTMGFKVRRILEKNGQVVSYYSWGNDTLETSYQEGVKETDKRIDHIAFRVRSCADIKTYLEGLDVVCGDVQESVLGGYNVMNVNGPDRENLQFIDRPSLEEYTF